MGIEICATGDNSGTSSNSPFLRVFFNIEHRMLIAAYPLTRLSALTPIRIQHQPTIDGRMPRRWYAILQAEAVDAAG